MSELPISRDSLYAKIEEHFDEDRQVFLKSRIESAERAHRILHKVEMSREFSRLPDRLQRQIKDYVHKA